MFLVVPVIHVKEANAAEKLEQQVSEFRPLLDFISRQAATRRDDASQFYIQTSLRY